MQVIEILESLPSGKLLPILPGTGHSFRQLGESASELEIPDVVSMNRGTFMEPDVDLP
ncbi:MAG TPA: hypothetical protein VG457_10980 [Planctomycetota bacterium]|nr:hypothetical protein [Planctomycetota bacterium]